MKPVARRGSNKKEDRAFLLLISSCFTGVSRRFNVFSPAHDLEDVRGKPAIKGPHKAWYGSFFVVPFLEVLLNKARILFNDQGGANVDFDLLRHQMARKKAFPP